MLWSHAYIWRVSQWHKNWSVAMKLWRMRRPQPVVWEHWIDTGVFFFSKGCMNIRIMWKQLSQYSGGFISKSFQAAHTNYSNWKKTVFAIKDKSSKSCICVTLWCSCVVCLCEKGGVTIPALTFSSQCFETMGPPQSFIMKHSPVFSILVISNLFQAKDGLMSTKIFTDRLYWTSNFFLAFRFC